MDTRSIPTWAVPDQQQVRDLRAIAARHNGRGALVAGYLDAIDWVTGHEQLSPVGQQPGPVTELAANQELDRASRSMRTNDWARGVADALAWFVGLLRDAPLPIPARNPDGSTVAEEQLYAEMIEGQQWGPERRAKAWFTAQQGAYRWRQLAADIDG